MKNVYSPSGRFEVGYSEGTEEQDAAYWVSDRLKRYREEYSICSGNDTPLNESTFIWSPSELTFVVLQSGEAGRPDRFVLAQLDASPGEDWWCLLKMKPLEQRIFGGEAARLVSASDTSIGFRIGNSFEIRQILIKDLENEAHRQERE
jgi:hypothetical protein